MGKDRTCAVGACQVLGNVDMAHRCQYQTKYAGYGDQFSNMVNLLTLLQVRSFLI
jgi:hypothetical protein